MFHAKVPIVAKGSREGFGVNCCVECKTFEDLDDLYYNSCCMTGHTFIDYLDIYIWTNNGGDLLTTSSRDVQCYHIYRELHR